MVQAFPRISRSGRFIRCALIFWALACHWAFAAGDGAFAPPEQLPTERYAAIWDRSPFELKTVAAAVTNTRSFAENLALAGFSDKEGQITIYLKDKSSGAYTKLTNETPSDSGIAFDKIVEDPDPRQVKVSLRKGTETALVGYSQEQMNAQGASGLGGGGAAPAPGMLGKKPPAPSLPAAPGALPPPGADPAAAQQKSRRRIILPQSAPQSSITSPPVASNSLIASVHTSSPHASR
jgi:hypothetical protein